MVTQIARVVARLRILAAERLAADQSALPLVAGSKKLVHGTAHQPGGLLAFQDEQAVVSETSNPSKPDPTNTLWSSEMQNSSLTRTLGIA